MQSRTKKVIAAVIVAFLIIGTLNAGMLYLQAAAKREQNRLLELRLVELKAQNDLLHQNKMCMAKASDMILSDTICGPNPDAFASPSPSPRTEHRHQE